MTSPQQRPTTRHPCRISETLNGMEERAPDWVAGPRHNIPLCTLTYLLISISVRNTGASASGSLYAKLVKLRLFKYCSIIYIIKLLRNILYVYRV